MLERGEIRLVGYGSRLSLEIKVGHVNVKIIHEVISFKLIRPYRTSQIMMRIEKNIQIKDVVTDSFHQAVREFSVFGSVLIIS